MADVFKDLFLPNATEPPKLQPTFAQTMASAFNLENDVANFLDYVTTPVHKLDPEFSALKEMEGKPLSPEMQMVLAKATSKEQYDQLYAKTMKEYQDHAVLAASGWSGTVAALSAGVVSPTVFIPFSGQARGGLAFAEVLMLATAGAGVQNGALYLNQETRSEGELYAGVAMDTLLMGMMGGAWLKLSKEGQVRLGKDVAVNQNNVTVKKGPLDNPSFEEVSVRVTPTEAFEIKRRVREENIRDPEEVRGLMEEADLDGEFVPLRMRPLEIGRVKEVSVARADLPKAQWAKTLEVPLTEGVRARFVAVTAETKLPGERVGDFKVTLVDDAGTAIKVAVDSERLTGISDAALLRKAISEGKLDDKFYSLLEKADDTGMARSPDEAAIPNSKLSETPSADARSAGAAATRKRNTQGAAKAPNRARQAALDTLGEASPSYRMLTNKFFPSLRDAIAKLDMSGIKQAGLETAEASADAGTTISRIQGYEQYVMEFQQSIDRQFYKYTHGTDRGFDFNSPMLTQIKSVYGTPPPGKLSWPEYKAAVFDGLNTGEVADEFADSVESFKAFFKNYLDRQKQYLGEMQAAGIDVEPLFKELTEAELGPGVVDYTHHIFDKVKLMENMSEFLDDFTKYNNKALQAEFAKAREGLAKRQAKLDFEKKIADSTPEEVKQLLIDTESDIEFLDELPEMVDYKAELVALRKQAKDEAWPKEQLKAFEKELKAGRSEDLVELQAERARHMAAARMLRKYGGNADEVTAKLKTEIDAVDELVSKMFRHELPGIEKADLTIGRVQKEGDKELASVQKKMLSVVKQLAARNAKMRKLLLSKRGNTVSRTKLADQLEQSRETYAGLEDRLSVVAGQQVSRDAYLTELANIRERVVADANKLVRQRALRLEKLEEKLTETEAKVLTPEERSRMSAQIAEEKWQREQEFVMKWADRGEASGSPATTDAPNFTERARELAHLLHQKLMGTEIDLSPAYNTIRQGARGAELLRTLKIPYAIKNKWLVKDIELGARAYNNVMGPDLEIWRTFDGSVNGRSVLGEMQQEATEHYNRINSAKFVRLPKGWVDKASAFSDKVKKRLAEVGDADDIYLEGNNFSDAPATGFVEITPALRNQLNKSVHDAVEAQTRNFDIAISRLRRTRGVPENGGSFLYRTGRVVKNLNTTTMMGGVVASSISDVARPINRYGVEKTLKRGWAPYVKSFANLDKSNFRIKAKEVNNRLTLNIEPFTHGRSQSMFDLADSSLNRTKLERGVAFAANKMGLIAMYDYWTAGMKSIASNVVHATMAEYVPTVAKYIREGKEPVGDALVMRTYLRKMGLSDVNIHRIGLQMEKADGMEHFSNGGVLPNIAAWDDVVAYQAYQAGLIKEVNELIVTPGLEKANWTDENMAYSMVAQFKSFTFSANSRMTMSNLQGNDPYIMQGIAFSLAFGALSYYTYATAAGGRTLEKANEGDWMHWVDEAVKRSGFMGVLSFGADAMEKIPAATGQKPSVFTKPDGIIGTFLGPTYGQATKLASAISQIGTDSDKQKARALHNLRQVFIPYQNHLLTRRFYDKVENALIGGAD